MSSRTGKWTSLVVSEPEAVIRSPASIRTDIETAVETGVTLFDAGGIERYGRPSLDGGTSPLIRRNAPIMPYISLSCDIFQFNSPSLLISPMNHLTLAVTD